MAEPICPMRDGRHQILVTKWGQSCRNCHKTWEWENGNLIPTWEKHNFQPPQELK